MKVIAITSGKGGVGKTNISANLAISLASFGERVVVLDGDIGLANLDVVLGCKATWTLQHVISGEKTLSEIIQAGPGNIHFIAGGSGIENLFTLSNAQSERFTSDLAELAASTDILLLDTGAGLDSNVLTFLNAASEILIVVTPDPASVTDGYATAKAVVTSNREARVSLIINQVVDKQEATEIFDHLYGVAERFLNIQICFAGYVRYDREAIGFIRKRIPFVIGDRNLAASIDLMRIAADLLGRSQEPANSSKSSDFLSKIRSIFQLSRKIA